MKRNPLITYLIASSCVLGACTTTVVDESDLQDTAISFSTPETRAVVEGHLPDGSDFKIWGYRTSNEAPYKIITDFDGEKVHGENGIWNYEGGTRYWIPGYTYNFYALYPFYPTESQNEGITAKCDEKGNLTVTNFDCSKTGPDAVDLMTTVSDEFKEPNIPESVPLSFSHELARLKFVVQSEGSVVNIKKFKLNGVIYKGSLSKVQSSTPSTVSWNPLAITSDGDGIFNSSEFTLSSSEGNQLTKDVFGDMIVIPHSSIQLEKATLFFSYRYSIDTSDRTTEIKLSTSETPNGWQSGNSYKYTIIIDAGQLNISVSVNKWKLENTDVSWGDKEEGTL